MLEKKRRGDKGGKTKSRAAETTGKTTGGKTAGKSKKGKPNCPFCNKKYRANDSVNWVQCTKCELWMHGQCTGVTNDEIVSMGEEEIFQCKKCANI